MGIYNINILLVIFGILLECSSIKSDEATEFKNFIKERCRSNVPETTFEDKMREINEHEHGMWIMDTLSPSKKEKFCSESAQKSITISLQNYTEVLMECFPKEEKFIPKFINESYNEYWNVLCASNGTNIDDLFSSEANDCSENMKKANVEKCESKLTLNGTLTKNKICRDLKNIEKCRNDILQEHCSSQTKYISVHSKILGAIGKPCNAIEDTPEEETK